LQIKYEEKTQNIINKKTTIPTTIAIIVLVEIVFSVGFWSLNSFINTITTDINNIFYEFHSNNIFVFLFMKLY
jgi:hypothetical protein